jgi:protein gp37
MGGNRYIVVTKRPKMALAWTKRTSLGWWQRGWPKNVALLVTTENQERYDERIEYLQRIPVYPAGVIVEPMLGPVDLGFYPPISWVVAGPETGRCPRLFRDEWLDDLETQCMAVGIAFFDKREEWNTRMWPEGFRPGA